MIGTFEILISAILGIGIGMLATMIASNRELEKIKQEHERGIERLNSALDSLGSRSNCEGIQIK